MSSAEKPIVHFLSGLGANAKTFSLLDLSWCRPVFIEWMPVEAGESMASYAERLFRQSVKDEKALIAGLSFGGMLATEMARAYPDTKVMIISSNKRASELPWWLRTGKYLPLYRLKRNRSGGFTKALLRRFLSPADAVVNALMEEIAAETDPGLTSHFIDLIMRWPNQPPPPNLFHLHGNADRLLPSFCIGKPVEIVEGGHHLMIMNQPAAISARLKSYFAPADM